MKTAMIWNHKMAQSASPFICTTALIDSHLRSSVQRSKPYLFWITILIKYESGSVNGYGRLHLVLEDSDWLNLEFIFFSLTICMRLAERSASLIGKMIYRKLFYEKRSYFRCPRWSMQVSYWVSYSIEMKYNIC